MSDLFQDGVPAPFVERVFETMAAADWHTYQVLTKRAELMRELVRGLPKRLVEHAHVWLGVSVEDRKYGVPRIDVLREVPAALRFLSIEPLLEDVGSLNLAGIHWVIVGGESGPKARPMKPEWVISVRDQCRAQNVPFFFKQWGGVQKSKHGRELDGRTWDEFPARRESSAPRPRGRSRLSMLPAAEE
jgi:protein gp37